MQSGQMKNDWYRRQPSFIDEILRQNPDILLYYVQHGWRQASPSALDCSCVGFNSVEQQKRYAIRSVGIHGEYERLEYVALIVERSNPNLDDILSIFDEETAMFNEIKHWFIFCQLYFLFSEEVQPYRQK